MLYISQLYFFILFLHKYPFVPNGYYTIKCLDNRLKNLTSFKWIQLCLNCIFPLWPIMSMLTLINKSRFMILIIIHNIKCYKLYKSAIKNLFIFASIFSHGDITYWDIFIFINFVNFMCLNLSGVILFMALESSNFQLAHFEYLLIPDLLTWKPLNFTWKLTQSGLGV